MREELAEKIAKESEPHLKRMVLSEFLQHLVLQSLYRHGFFKQLTFTGGTALRLLYRTGRYSEDLDFSMADAGGLDSKMMLQKIHTDLQMQNFAFEFQLNEERVVSAATLKFSALLYEFKLSPLVGQKLTIKIEVDKNPPTGGHSELALVSDPLSYSVSVFDLPSLFATKLHAVFFRRYAKGRDFYDLIWYLGRKVQPNFELLNNAIRQTHPDESEMGQGELKARLIKRLDEVDFNKVRADVERFIMRREELEFLNADSIKSLLRGYP